MAKQLTPEESLRYFETWAATMSEHDFKQIIYRRKLNRADIATLAGIGRSALDQNPEVKKSLEKLEDRLRHKGVLPKKVNTTRKNQPDKLPVEYDQTATGRMLDGKRASWLEAENLQLKVVIKDLEQKLESANAETEKVKSKSSRFNELSETLVEFGMVPR